MSRTPVYISDGTMRPYEGYGLPPGSPEAKAVIERVRQALRPRSERKPRFSLVSFGEADCPVCGTTFVKHAATKVYCSDRCKKKAYREAQDPSMRECAVCGKSFRATGNARTCSGACSAALRDDQQRRARQRKRERRDAERASLGFASTACPSCGTTFTPKRSNQIYCSRSCQILAKSRAAYERKRANRINAGAAAPTGPISCPGCGETFTPARSGQRYCSPACANRSWKRDARATHKKAHPPRVCTVCGEMFQPVRANHVYCSRRCAMRGYRAAHPTEPTKIMRACAICGETFTIDGKRIYCSDACAYQAHLVRTRERRARKKAA